MASSSNFPEPTKVYAINREQHESLNYPPPQQPSPIPPASISQSVPTKQNTSQPPRQEGFDQIPQIIAIFEEREAGKIFNTNEWIEFQLVQGEYEELQRRLERNEELFGYVQDKIRYDYNARNQRLVIRMPTTVHECFIDDAEDTIRIQLRKIACGSDEAALFAKKLRSIRSSDIYFPFATASPYAPHSHFSPDSSFCHKEVQYPGVILEVTNANKEKKISRLAPEYLLGSKGEIRIVIGFDLGYGTRSSPKATFSVWRCHVVDSADGKRRTPFPEIADEAFRDEQGKPTDHPGLRFHLSDFACGELTAGIIGKEDREITISTQELCQYLTDAEEFNRMQRVPRNHSDSSDITDYREPQTPPEEIAADEEAKYVEQEERAAERMDLGDSDYDSDHYEDHTEVCTI